MTDAEILDTLRGQILGAIRARKDSDPAINDSVITRAPVQISLKKCVRDARTDAQLKVLLGRIVRSRTSFRGFTVTHAELADMSKCAFLVTFTGTYDPTR